MRRQKILPAKITRPGISKAYLRRRLFHLLDQRQKCKALYVSGPPGAGKTTLVSSYVESRDIPCLWYQVDSGDKDPATFFHHCGLAAKCLSPGKRKALPHFTPEYLSGLATFTRNFFGELFQRMSSPSLLVLDNFQEASGDPEFLS